MTFPLQWSLTLASVILLPLLNLGLIRKTKALLQNRIGAPICQPFVNIWKLLHKRETVSSVASWLFRANSAVNLAIILLVAILAPWLSFKPPLGGDDLFVVVYFLALARFFSILSSLDTGSAFGAFGASREATISLLIEPAVVLSLIALAVPVRSTSLGQIFTFAGQGSSVGPILWILSGTGLFLSSLVELSRMPVDDPTTHLELTMVHEAMILENSAKNLALIEFAQALRMVVLFGLSTQCFLHAADGAITISQPLMGALSLVGILCLGLITALIEATSVKLQWRKIPEFIAYALTMGFLATLVAITKGGSLWI